MYRFLFRSFALVYKVKKSWIIFTLLFRVINGLMPLAELWILQSIVNKVSTFISDNGELAPVIKLILLQFLIMTVKSSINEYMTLKDKEMQQTLDYHMGKNIMNKLVSVPYQNFEIPSFYNHQFRIKNNTGERFLRPITNMLEALQNVISILGYITFLFTLWGLIQLSHADHLTIPWITLLIFLNAFGYLLFLIKQKQKNNSNEINICILN